MNKCKCNVNSIKTSKKEKNQVQHLYLLKCMLACVVYEKEQLDYFTELKSFATHALSVTYRKEAR